MKYTYILLFFFVRVALASSPDSKLIVPAGDCNKDIKGAIEKLTTSFFERGVSIGNNVPLLVNVLSDFWINFLPGSIKTTGKVLLCRPFPQGLFYMKCKIFLQAINREDSFGQKACRLWTKYAFKPFDMLPEDSEDSQLKIFSFANMFIPEHYITEEFLSIIDETCKEEFKWRFSEIDEECKKKLEEWWLESYSEQKKRELDLIKNRLLFKKAFLPYALQMILNYYMTKYFWRLRRWHQEKNSNQRVKNMYNTIDVLTNFLSFRFCYMPFDLYVNRAALKNMFVHS